MTDDLPTSPAHNLPEQSVSDLSNALKRTVEGAFSRVRVRGEVSAPKLAGSGHCYLRLKDETAVLDGIIWRGAYAKLGIRPQEGMDVVVTGRLTTYPGRSSYQIVIETMDLAGEGALLKLLEERKRQLAAEGLFAAERKKPLPFLPRVIGVVTSPTGAVIRDILHRLNDRFPCHVLVWPVLVQGEGAAAQIAAAVEGFNRLPSGGAAGSPPRPDLLIVARGGGSLEDLMAFNEEIVVRAVAASAIPVISAVGHETDTTLCDFAADLRAPTPTGAAEMAVPVRLDLLAQVREDTLRLDGAARRLIGDRTTRLEGLARGLPDPLRLLEDQAQRLDDRAERLRLALAGGLDARLAAVQRLGASLRSPREQIATKAADLRQRAAALDSGWKMSDQGRRAALASLSARLRSEPLHQTAERGAQDLARLGQRLNQAVGRLHREARQTAESWGERLDSVSYKATLQRGYAMVRDDTGTPVTSATKARPGTPWTIDFADGTTPVMVAGTPPKNPRRKAEDGRQESLF